MSELFKRIMTNKVLVKEKTPAGSSVKLNVWWFFRPPFCTVRLHWAGDNLGKRDELCYESWCRITWSVDQQSTCYGQLSLCESRTKSKWEYSLLQQHRAISYPVYSFNSSEQSISSSAAKVIHPWGIPSLQVQLQQNVTEYNILHTLQVIVLLQLAYHWKP